MKDTPSELTPTIESDSAVTVDRGATRAAGDHGLHLGRVAAGAYELHGELARGGLGRVLSARDRRLGRPVAVKELLDHSPEDVARFLREVRITARLQHPSIVPVYAAGRWPNGDPFYAMKMVSGRPLSQIIDETPAFAGRLALLPHIIAAAEAVAYAHSEGVVHRDLKPANILVGSFGETIVIDWGLAKDLRESAAEPISERQPASLAETVAGTVLGTPVFMPPEQARGEVVDARADVYALGATLYKVLSGKLPYRGESTAEVIAQVVSGPPPALDALAPQVPRDLVTIVDKAMSRDPGDRYPTAKALAEDLERFATGQLVRAHDYTTGALVRRFVRRNFVALLVAAVLVTVLAVGAFVAVRQILAEGDLARRESEIAVHQRSAAERVIQNVVVDLRQRLEPLGRLALLRGMADEVTTYYESVSRDSPGVDVDAEDRRSTALAVLGDVRYANGDLAGAEAQYRNSLAIRTRLWVASPADDARATAVGASLDDIGRVIEWKGDTDAALPWLEWSWAILAPACDRHADDPECARALAAALRDLGDAANSRGDGSTAVADLSAAVGIDETLVARDPAKVAWQHDLARSRDALTRPLLLARDATRASALVQTNLHNLLEVTTRYPTDLVLTGDLMWAYTRLGTLERKAGDLGAAQGDFGRARELAARLAQSDPDNATWVRLATEADDNIAEILAATGHAEAAVALERKVIVELQRLADMDPENGQWRIDLASGKEALGDKLFATGEVLEARDLYRQAVDIAVTQARRYPRDMGLQINLASYHNSLGDALSKLGEWGAARAEYTAALAQVATFQPVDRLRVRWHTQAADAYDGLGDVDQSEGQSEAAIHDYEAAATEDKILESLDPTWVYGHWKLLRLLGKRLAMLVTLARFDDIAGPIAEGRGYVAERGGEAHGNEDCVEFLAQARSAEGDALRAQGRRAEAVAAQRDAVAIVSRYAARNPDDADAEQAIEDMSLDLGETLLDAGDARSAATAFARVVVLARRGAADSPDDVDRKEDLAHGLVRFAQASRGAPARHALDEAQAIIDALPPARRSAEMRRLLAECARRRAQLP